VLKGQVDEVYGFVFNISPEDVQVGTVIVDVFSHAGKIPSIPFVVSRLEQRGDLTETLHAHCLDCRGMSPHNGV